MQWWLAGCLWLACCLTVDACEVTDDLGHRVNLGHPANRIISLAPDLTENLFAIGAGARIIGVIQGSDYPKAAKKIPVVANFYHMDSETVLSLHPDLIVAWVGSPQLLQLKNLGVPVYVADPKHLLDVPLLLRNLGCLVGSEEQAEQVAKTYTQHYQQLVTAFSHQKKLSIFYQIWPDPPLTVAKESWINEAITLCGGRNVFANLRGKAPQVSLESIIAINPDMIITADHKNDWKDRWKRWPSMRAVANGQLMSMDPDIIERASPRLMDGVSELCRLLESARERKLSG